jgi:hypothetical protein
LRLQSAAWHARPFRNSECLLSVWVSCRSCPD